MTICRPQVLPFIGSHPTLRFVRHFCLRTIKITALNKTFPPLIYKFFVSVIKRKINKSVYFSSHWPENYTRGSFILVLSLKSRNINDDQMFLVCINVLYVVVQYLCCFTSYVVGHDRFNWPGFPFSWESRRGFTRVMEIYHP